MTKSTFLEEVSISNDDENIFSVAANIHLCLPWLMYNFAIPCLCMTGEILG